MMGGSGGEIEAKDMEGTGDHTNNVHYSGTFNFLFLYIICLKEISSIQG